MSGLPELDEEGVREKPEPAFDPRFPKDDPKEAHEQAIATRAMTIHANMSSCFVTNTTLLLTESPASIEASDRSFCPSRDRRAPSIGRWLLSRIVRGRIWATGRR